MAASLIQALYNMVDSLFVSRYAELGLTVLSIIYSIQLLMIAYARMSTDSPKVIADVTAYGRIVCAFSFGLFLESVWTKVLQSRGDMKTPMAAQVVGVVVNMILDPILIFGLLGAPRMGISGAAVATVVGQTAAALCVAKKGFVHPPRLREFPLRIGEIFRLGVPQHPHAVGLHLLHLRTQPYTSGLFRLGGDGTGALL